MFVQTSMKTGLFPAAGLFCVSGAWQFLHWSSEQLTKLATCVVLGLHVTNE